MSVALADGNVLIALVFDDHVHHAQASAWLDAHEGGFATCPITQGTLLRHLFRAGVGRRSAIEVLMGVCQLAQHVFLADEIGYERDMLNGVIGHRQVSDAYLAALAVYHGARLVTLDRALAALHPQAAVLIEH